VGDTGLEQVSHLPGETAISEKRGTVSGTLPEIDRGLAKVITAWPLLDPHRRAIIVGMAKRAIIAGR
jgi:hypothetical protein